VDEPTKSLIAGRIALSGLGGPEGGTGPANHPDGSLAPQERSFLEDVHVHPAAAVTERYQRLGLGRSQGTRIQAALLRRGMLEVATISAGGAHVRALGLTPEGYTALDIPQPSDRLGGPEHRYWVARIGKELRDAGLAVQEEAMLQKGHACDLLVVKDGKCIAIEVETGKSDWKGNVDRCLAAGMNNVIVASTSPRGLSALRPAPEGEATCIVRPDQAGAAILES